MKSSSILLVDDDPVIIRSISRILADVAEVRFATNGEAALRLARESMPDLILLDSEMPGMSGFQVCEAFQSDSELVEVPIIFVTSHSDTAMHVAGLEAGAVDFIAKPISEPLLLARVKSQLRIKRLTDELRSATMVDPLTQIANRRRFDDKLSRECARCVRTQEPLSVLMIDVDYFKRFNDNYGHPAGDVCLKKVAAVLEKSCHRPADLAARYGGEEFTLVLPGVALKGAEHVAHRILEALSTLALPHAKSSISKFVTVSIGIGYFNKVPRNGAERDLLAAADKALYAAKSGGRAQAWAMDALETKTGQPESINEASLPGANGASAP
jgi:diguanylate cyclase (GGDEF)-like protein